MWYAFFLGGGLEKEKLGLANVFFSPFFGAPDAGICDRRDTVIRQHEQQVQLQANEKGAIFS